jgi:Na+/H+ antiporter NhaD/arsenite permease-like protein
MDEGGRRRLVAGTVLILLGGALFVVQQFEGISFEAVFFLVGGIFLAAYLFKKEYGLLIPGCIMLGMGTGASLRGDSDLFGNTMIFGLGLGFVAIFLIALLYERRSHWWPLIPGAVLILISIRDAEEIIHYLFTRGWPLILVFVGLMILLGAFGKPRRRGTPGGP